MLNEPVLAFLKAVIVLLISYSLYVMSLKRIKFCLSVCLSVCLSSVCLSVCLSGIVFIMLMHSVLTFEPSHDKTNKMTVRTGKTQLSLSPYLPIERKR